MLSDPGSVDKSKPMLLTLDLPMLPSATAWASATPSRIYEAQSLRLLPTACLFLGLRITHVVTYTSPKLDPGCGGYRFPERTFTSGYISASWRTTVLFVIPIMMTDFLRHQWDYLLYIRVRDNGLYHFMRIGNITVF